VNVNDYLIFIARCYADCDYATVCGPSVRPSVCLSICDVQACFSHRLEYFENNLRLISVRFLLNTGDLVQRETPELGWNRGGVNL